MKVRAFDPSNSRFGRDDRGLAQPVDAITQSLAGVGYIASRRIATALLMANHLQKPILVEGQAGVGKTESAIATSTMLGLAADPMQCYEGLDEAKALYEWKYGSSCLHPDPQGPDGRDPG